MKTIKAFGLTLLAVLPITMFAGTGSSSATVLCSMEIGTCPSTLAYAAKTKFTAHLVNETVATIVAGTSTLKCKESTLSGSTKEKEGEPLPGEVTAFEFSSCSLVTGEKSITCASAKGIHLPFSASFASTETQGHGTLALSDSGKGVPAIEFTCEKTKCAYSMKPSFEVGGEPTWLSVTNATATLEKEPACALKSEATFNASYEVSEPASAHLSVAKAIAQGTKLCKAIPPIVGGVRQCPAGQEYAGSSIKANPSGGFPATFTFNTEKVLCNEMKLTGNFQENGIFAAANGGIQTFTYNSGGGNCTSTLAGGNPAVAVTMINLKYDESDIVYLQREKPQGQLGFQGTNGVVKLRMVIGATTCNYRRDALAGQISNGEVAGASTFLEISANWQLEAQPGGCPTHFIQTPLANFATFEQGGGAALYVAKE